LAKGYGTFCRYVPNQLQPHQRQGVDHILGMLKAKYLGRCLEDDMGNVCINVYREDGPDGAADRNFSILGSMRWRSASKALSAPGPEHFSSRSSQCRAKSARSWFMLPGSCCVEQLLLMGHGCYKRKDCIEQAARYSRGKHELHGC
jgi:hypothetical protein